MALLSGNAGRSCTASGRRPWLAQHRCLAIGLAAALAVALGGCGSGPSDGTVLQSHRERPANPGAPVPSAGQRTVPAAPPEQIVSLDYCADQYVVRFVESDRILAVSPDAAREFSYMRDHAAGLPTVRPVAEDVITLQPDLVVRSYGGGPLAPAMFERAGIAVLTIDWAEDIEAIARMIESTARALGAAEQGLAVAADMRERLAALPPVAPGTEALYMTPSGVTAGPATLVDEMFRAAGLDNFQTQPGWREIPLERLAYEQPDLIVPAFFDSLADHPDAWSPMRHPVARAQLQARAVVPVEGAWTACGAWFLVDAVEALAQGASR